MGHALNNTLQDMLCRFERMRGKDVLWQPGMDHAGIATQMVVERQLMERQQPGRREMGREAFLERVWAWKDESGGTIIKPAQAPRRLLRLVARALHHGRGPVAGRAQGVRRPAQAGPDLQGQAARELGPASSRPRSPTSRSSRSRSRATSGTSATPSRAADRIDHRRHDAARDDAGRHGRRGASRTTSATRPRSASMVGPAAGRPPHPDRRRRLLRSREGHRRGEDHARRTTSTTSRSAAATSCRLINIFDAEAQIAARRQRGVPRRARGQRRPDRGAGARTASTASTARKRIVAMLEERGLARQDRAARPHGAARRPLRRRHRALADRPVVRRRQDAGPAGARGRARRAGPRSCPKNWEKTYFEWLENIEPWCISRQLWWGHQIPAWYGPDGTVFVAKSEAEAQQAAAARTTARRRRADARRGRARHLVLLRALAVLDARLAGRDAGAGALLPDQRAGDRLRHHLLLGRPDDDDGPALHEGGPVPHRLHPRPRPRREGREDVEVEGQRHRSRWS